MAKKSNARVFKDYTEEDAAQAKEEIDQNEAKEFAKLKEGRNVLRILPARGDAKHAAIVRVWQHKFEVDVGKEKPKFVSFNCPSRMTKGEHTCEECKFEVEAARDNSLDEQVLWKRKPQRTCYANVKMGGADSDSPVQILRFGKLIDDQLTEMLADYGKYTNIEEGYDIVINRPKETNGNKDRVIAANKGAATPLDPNGKWVDELHDLSKYLKIPTPEEVIAKMEGKDEVPRRQLGSGPRTAGSLPEKGYRRKTVQDDVEDDDEDDDDEEDERPAKSKVTQRKVDGRTVVEVNDDDDDDDDEDDEDEDDDE